MSNSNKNDSELKAKAREKLEEVLREELKGRITDEELELIVNTFDPLGGFDDLKNYFRKYPKQ